MKNKYKTSQDKTIKQSNWLALQITIGFVFLCDVLSDQTIICPRSFILCNNNWLGSSCAQFSGKEEKKKGTGRKGKAGSPILRTGKNKNGYKQKSWWCRVAWDWIPRSVGQSIKNEYISLVFEKLFNKRQCAWWSLALALLESFTLCLVFYPIRFVSLSL